jgi:hypothetical protein
MHILKIAAFLLSALTLTSCGGKTDAETILRQEEETHRELSHREKPQNYKMPDDMSEYRGTLSRHLREVFNDSNMYQYAHARYMGIDPIASVDMAYNTTRPLLKVSDTELYKLDSLTHSVPFLVPEAKRLLEDIGRGFRDTIARRDLPKCRLRVTSLLRTPASVKKLRRINGNATDSSTHQFATTFDIAYNAFYSHSGDLTLDNNPRYKMALAEVLYDLRSRNRCMVKYECKSPCFHITVIQ